MSGLLSAAAGKPGTEDLLLSASADTEEWHGKVQMARELTGRAVHSAERNNANESAANYLAREVLREAEIGTRAQAEAYGKAALNLVTSRDVAAMTTLGLARAGDTVRAESLAANLNDAFPTDTLVQHYWLPTIRAAVQLQHGHPSKALVELEIVTPYELGWPMPIRVVLYPVYLRGQANLIQRDGRAAAGEFRKLIEHRGLVANFVLGVLAHLQLARAYAMQSDTAKARAAYKDFLTLWKDADPDIPILKEAKAEYAKLQ